LSQLLSEENISLLAKQSNFEERSSGKVRGIEILDLLLKCGFGDEKLSLDNLCESFEEQTGKTLTKQSLQERFTERLSNFIKMVLEKVLVHNTDEAELEFIKGKSFKNIRIKDSTSFQLPESLKEYFKGCGGSGSKSGIKIQFEYDYLSGEVYELSLGHGKDSDLNNTRATINNLGEGDLSLTDLGYVETKSLPVIQERKAFYLYKLHGSVDVYRKTKNKFKKVDFVAIERFMKSNRVSIFEITAYVGQKEKQPTRLIIELVPEEIKQERIKKIKAEAKSRQRNVCKSYIDRAGLNLFITNLDNAQLNINQVRKLYRLRWQVELIFKIWKSIGKLHRVQKMKYDRFVSCLYAKLLWFFINWKILWKISIGIYLEDKKLISFYKAFKSLSKRKEADFSIVKHDVRSIAEFIQNLARRVERYYLLEKRSDNLSSLEILWQYKIGFDKE